MADDDIKLPSGWTATPVDSIPGGQAIPGLAPGWTATPVDALPEGVSFGQTAPAEKSKETGAVARMGENFLDVLAAGAQGTSPVVTGGGKYNYQLAPPEAQAVFQETGLPQNQQTQVALRDPATNQYRVYMRNPEMAESAGPALGRVLAYGVPETGIPMVATPSVPNAAQNLMRDFEISGVTPNLPLVGQSRVTGLATNMLANAPWAAERIKSGIGETLGETAASAERLASGMGTAGTPEEAGNVVQSAVKGFAKGDVPEGMTPSQIIAQPTRESNFATKADTLYNRFWSQVDPNKPLPIDNTLAALKGPLERFPSSPELGSQITNPRLQQFFKTLSPQENEIPAVYSKVLDSSGNPILLQAAQKVQSGGNLTFGEMKELRSTIGRMLGDSTLISDIPRADLKNVYAGISTDLGNAAAAEGPGAARAFQAANGYYRAGMNRIDQLEPLLAGSPEKTFAAINRAASPGPSADVGMLRSLQRSMDPSDWRQVGATVLRKMGEPTPGAKDVLNETQFSPSSFATNWNKLSPAAKDTIFGENVPNSTRESLEALTRVAQSQKNLGKLANVSHSGEYTTGALLVAGAVEHMDELIAHPFLTIAVLMTPRAFAGALMSPRFARWLYQMPQTIKSAPSPAIGAQRALGMVNTMARQLPQ